MNSLRLSSRNFLGLMPIKSLAKKEWLGENENLRATFKRQMHYLQEY